MPTPARDSLVLEHRAEQDRRTGGDQAEEHEDQQREPEAAPADAEEDAAREHDVAALEHPDRPPAEDLAGDELAGRHRPGEHPGHHPEAAGLVPSETARS